jgi:glycosyltransferase involved in cell wall biosynthesis
LERNIAGRSRFWDRLQWGVVERRLIHRCAAVSTVAEGIARHLEKRYGLSKVELIRNVQPFTPPSPKSHVLADELGIDRGRRIALYAGGILRHRGIENLIRAARLASDRTAWVVMGYATQPAFLDELRDLAEREGVLGTRLYFRDAVPPDLVNEYAASSDVAVVPTEAICLSYEFEASNKIFHSVMARVPVAMSDHIEKRLLNERHGIGVLFDETDPEGIARTVEAFLDDRVAYDAAVEACGRAAELLNWEHEERTLLSMFGRVLEPATVQP